MAFPVVVRVLLIAASIASYLPQYYRILSRGDCVGITAYYIFFNLIWATEHFLIGLHYVVASEMSPDFIRDPPNLSNWLDFTQFTVVWLCSLVLFGLFLHSPPAQRRTKITMAIIYLVFVLLVIGPIIFEAFLPRSDQGGFYNDRALWASTISFVHIVCLHPIATILASAALFPQLRELRSRGDVGALSTTGLAAQAAVFFILAICWVFRLPTDEEWPVGSPMWYAASGYATVDNAIFAFAQAVLLIVAERLGLSRMEDAETEPLLSTEL